MNKELVLVKKDIAFTTSLIIAEGTGNQHKNVKELIVKYQDDLKEFGTLSVLNVESTGGRPEQYYELNEEQATFLMTLLRNSEVVVAFKKELVKQFFAMRKLIQEKQTQEWQMARMESKVNRRQLTDGIKLFVEYCESQGSTHADMYYITFSKLANKAVGISSKKRDQATSVQLNTLSLVEYIIGNVIIQGISEKKPYKDIYQDCKKRIDTFVDVAYLYKTNGYNVLYLK